MKEFIESFSNRDITILFWIFVFIIYTAIKDRDLIKKTFTIFFEGKTLPLITLFFSSSYVLIIWGLHEVNLWDISLLKDSIFWYFTNLITFMLSITKIKSIKAFWIKIFEDVKIASVFKFYFSLYSFSFWVEFIGLPVVAFLIMVLTYSKHKLGQAHDLTKLLQKIYNAVSLVIIIGFIVVAFTTGHFLDLKNLKTFLLPFILITIISPLFYLLVCYIQYSDLTVNYRNYLEHSKSGYTPQNKKYPFFYAKLNLDKIEQLKKIINRNYFTKGLYNFQEFKSIINSVIDGTWTYNR